MHFIVRAGTLACFIKHASEDARTQRKNAFFKKEMLPIEPSTVNRLRCFDINFQVGEVNIMQSTVQTAAGNKK